MHSGLKLLRAGAISGQTYATGTLLTLRIGAAKRGSAVLERPNKHPAFGLGSYPYAGLQLARLKGRIAVLSFSRALRHISSRRRPQAAAGQDFADF
jgi:hypothetical protein